MIAGYNRRIYVQSTPPCGGATWIEEAFTIAVVAFSIHAPRVGSERLRYKTLAYRLDCFNPRPEWGATRPVPGYSTRSCFNHAPGVGATGTLERDLRKLGVSITPPEWGATHLPIAAQFIMRVSIHAPRVGSD